MVDFEAMNHLDKISWAILTAVLAPLGFAAAKLNRYMGTLRELRNGRGFRATPGKTEFRRPTQNLEIVAKSASFMRSAVPLNKFL
jgi:hypothetical protein